MKQTVVILITLLISLVGFSQDYEAEFNKYHLENDTVNQLRVLTKWEAEKPTDAELFSSYVNYYFMKSRKEVLSLSSEEPEGEGLILTDSLNQTAGYLERTIHYDLVELEKGIEKIDQGIKLYPNRLDMRFGKIYILGQIPDWERFTSEIIKTIQYSAEINNEWTWTHNEKQEDAKSFFLLSLQDYQVQLYNTDNDDLLINMRDIANEVLKYYPNHIESLSNLSITYLLTGEFDKGIKPLLRAEEINPKDYVILSNIAQGYKFKGDTKKAIEYYQKIIEHGDEQAIKYAKQQIMELQ